MPKFDTQTLKRIGVELFKSAGCSEKNARMVVDHLVESNLFGHDSHGAIRIYEYLEHIREGRFQADAEPRVVRETACTALVDGGGAIGQVGATFVAQLAIRKAREHGTCSVALRNTSHIGRAGAYPLMAAREGMMGLAFVNAGKLGYQIAPFGGIDGRLSTDPIAFAAPRRDSDPIMVDMTTSVVAEGKIRLARNQGKPVPEGWIIDHDGKTTTDPNVFFDGPGAILPMGGVVGHKGYGLSFVVELLGGTLSGQGCAGGERKMKSNGVLMTVYNIEHFTDLDTYYDEVEDLIRHIRTSRLSKGIREILVPGEPEFRSALKREEDGVEVDDTTWSRICVEAEALGLDPAKWEV